MELLTAFINVIFNYIFFRNSYREKEFSLFIWLILLYFSIIFFFIIFGADDLSHTFGWIGESIHINSKEYSEAIYFVLVANIFLAVGIKIGKKITPKFESIEFKKIDSYILLMLLIMGCMMHTSVVFNFSYTDFVEYKGSDWGRIFLYAGSGYILYLMNNKRYILTTVACVPFIYLVVNTGVRSYVLFSLISLLIYLLMTSRMNFRKIITIALFMILLSIYVMSNRLDDFSIDNLLPESSLVGLFLIVYTGIDDVKVLGDSNTLLLLLNALLMPYVKLFGPIYIGDDNPVLIAKYLEGTDNFGENFYHYPATIYSEMVVTMGYYGVTVGLFFGMIIGVFNKILLNNNLRYFFLPSFCWITYMIARGAPVIGFSAVSYVLWFMIIILLIKYILYKFK